MSKRKQPEPDDQHPAAANSSDSGSGSGAGPGPGLHSTSLGSGSGSVLGLDDVICGMTYIVKRPKLEQRHHPAGTCVVRKKVRVVEKIFRGGSMYESEMIYNRMCELPNGNVLIGENYGVYVLDVMTGVCIQLVDMLTLIAGNKAGYMPHVASVACDASGNTIFIAAERCSIYRLELCTGTLSLFAGESPHTRAMLMGVKDGYGTDARFTSITDMVHHAGKLYVSGDNHNVIRRVDCISGLVTTIANTASFPCQGQRDGTLAKAWFRTVYHLTIDAYGQLIFAESSKRNFIGRSIRRIDARCENVVTLLQSGQILREDIHYEGTLHIDRVLGCDALGSVFVSTVHRHVFLLDATRDYYPIPMEFGAECLLLTRSGDLYVIPDDRRRVMRLDHVKGFVSRRDLRFAFACGLHPSLGVASPVGLCGSVDRRLLRFVLDHL